jgi:hypothetical protein
MLVMPRRPFQSPPMPSPALTEMLASTGELDRILDGRGPLYEPTQVAGTPTPPAPGLYIPPPDWDAERRQREAQERAERIAEAAALLEAEDPRRPDPPAPKARK